MVRVADIVVGKAVHNGKRRGAPRGFVGIYAELKQRPVRLLLALRRGTRCAYRSYAIDCRTPAALDHLRSELGALLSRLDGWKAPESGDTLR